MTTLYDHPRYIPDKLCYLKTNEAVEAFRVGYKKYMNNIPSRETLAILVAQSALETGWWRAGLHCWNFGNTRCNPNKLRDDEYFTMFKAGEIINGKEVFFYPPHPGSVFQAFKTAEDGVAHHLKFLTMKDNYTKAWGEAYRGNPEQYIIELKRGGYFTASLDRYMKTFLSVYGRVLDQVEADDDIFTEDEKKRIMDLVALTMSELA